MSQSTSITEGGKGRPFGSVKALMVQGDDGKYFSWCPQSDKALGTLSVDKNGVYRASDKGVYGWGQVYVNVPQTDSVTGKDPDTGEEVVVRPDPETGEITETVVPVEIRVITPPTNPYGTYIDGQTITKDGMVVKAYSAKGEEMQVVPIGEITINPTTAVYDESKDKKGEPTIVPDASVQQYYSYYDALNPASQVTYDETSSQGDRIRVTATATNGAILYVIMQSSRYYVCAISQSSFMMDVVINGISFQNNSIQTGVSDLSGNTYHRAGFIEMGMKNTGDIINVMPDQQPNWSRMTSWEEIGDLTFYNSDITPGEFGSPQTITVSWPRPGDGAILETTFDILVGPRGGSGED